MMTVQKIKLIAGLVLSGFFASMVFANGNMTGDSFTQTKKILEKKVYFDHRVTLYCGASFDAYKNITLPEGFSVTKHVKRAQRVEWEHVVPAENFGRASRAWREGDFRCVRRVKGQEKPYKGRRCADKVDHLYRLQQSDMYNLYPAIGAVNALRSNYRFSELPHAASSFGSCAMKIDGKRVEPPEKTKGVIARTYFYMDEAYDNFSISAQQRKLFDVWDKTHPVSAWECERTRRIEKIQKNRNNVVIGRCQRAGL